jgi:predicted DCC family thiol-disulfide oxidoreductase YuxK
MPEVAASAFSYRDDPGVPGFDDRFPLFVFDGVCVLCSGGARWLMRVDKREKLRFASMQGVLGQALYRHYRVDPDESYLLIASGRAYTAMCGYLELCSILGGWWRLLLVLRVVPERLCDWAYAFVARHRYRWFGRVEYCALLTAEQRHRLL